MSGPRNQKRHELICIGSIKLRSGYDPFAKQIDLFGGERFVILRHAVVFIMSDEALEKFALVGFARRDRRFVTFARFEEGRESVDAVTALGFLGRMADKTFRNEDRRDVATELCGRRQMLRADEQREAEEAKPLGPEKNISDHSAENAKTVVLLNFSPGLTMEDGNSGRFGESGKCCVSRQSPRWPR